MHYKQIIKLKDDNIPLQSLLRSLSILTIVAAVDVAVDLR